MAPSTSLRAALGGHKYALLTTFRRNGQPVATPVWFALADNKVYFRTSPQTGKAKRLRYNPRVQVAPSTARGRPLGPVVEGTARLLGPEESSIARRALEQKYGLQVRLVDLWIRLRRPEQVFFEITPRLITPEQGSC